VVLSDTIAIANNTVLDSGGHQVAISGRDAVRVFYVNPQITFSVTDLAIINGCSTNGGGIYNNGGTVNATNCTFAGNRAVGPGGASYLDPNGREGRGGAIFNSGMVRLNRCTFSQNAALGGNGADAVNESYSAGAGGAADGGALYNTGDASASQCGFRSNSATAGAGGASGAYPLGGSGGGARAGGLCNLGTLKVDGSLFAENSAIGGSGANGRNSPNNGWGPVWLNDGGSGGSGGSACGALFAGGPSALVNCTLAANQAQGGVGGSGGSRGYFMDMGSGRYIYGSPGSGGSGGDAQAAFYDPTGVLRLTNCTIAFNSGLGGAGGSNGASGSPPGSTGIAGGGLVSSNSVLLNTLLATNTPSNCVGTIIDAGHNLSSDASGAFGGAGSLNNADPRLGPLADNGGPTLTLALLPGSPAIDAGDTASAPGVDQRGVARPFSTAADIGAYEFWPFLQANRATGGGLDILVTGLSGQWCRLLTSTNLAIWLPVATNQIGPTGTLLLHYNTQDSIRSFYRAAFP
jgi:hypothetical protein